MNTTNINEKATGFEKVLPRLEIDDEKRKFINWVNYYYEHNASDEVLSLFFYKALAVAQGLIPRFMINSKRYDLSLKLHNEFIRNHDDNSIYSTARIMLNDVYFQIDKLWNIQGLNYWDNLSALFSQSLKNEFNKVSVLGAKKVEYSFEGDSGNKFFNFVLGSAVKTFDESVSPTMLKKAFAADVEFYFFDLVSYEHERVIHQELLAVFNALEQKKNELKKDVLVDYSYFDGFSNAFLKLFAKNFKENSSLYSITQEDAENSISVKETIVDDDFNVDDFLNNLIDEVKSSPKKVGKKITAYAVSYRNGEFD